MGRAGFQRTPSQAIPQIVKSLGKIAIVSGISNLTTPSPIYKESGARLNNMENIYTFKDSEHLAGFHNTYQEGCYECHREARLIKAKQTVAWDNLYPNNSRNQNAISRSDFYTNKNPLG